MQFGNARIIITIALLVSIVGPILSGSRVKASTPLSHGAESLSPDKVENLITSYQIVDLGTLGGTQSFALDVNNNRQVTGNSLVTSEPGSTGSLLRAYLWTSGSMTNLGPLPGAGTNRFARGYAVNDAGTVVGEFNNDSSRAFVYTGGVMNGLTRLAGDNDNGVAHDINNSNVIVGISSNGTASRPTMWTSNGMAYVPADLGSIAGTATSTGRAWAINDAGVAVGLSQNAGATSQATRWSGGTVTNLGSLGDGTRFGQAYGLNDNGLIVGASQNGVTVGILTGTSSTTPITRAFRWQNGTMTELPPFNLYVSPGNTGPTTNYHSEAKDVNDAGLIVGNSQRIASSPAVATAWINGFPVDLNTVIPAGSGWTLLSAEGINDQGDIVGFGTLNGASRAFMLTAQPPSSSSFEVSGRVVTPDGRGLGRTELTMAFSDGSVRIARPSSFGYYKFGNVPAGSIVVISLISKGYSFQSRAILVDGELTGVDFIAME